MAIPFENQNAGWQFWLRAAIGPLIQPNHEFPASSWAKRQSALTPTLGPFIKLPTMPTYEYVCDKCGHAFEFVQSMSVKPLTVCPKELCPQKTWGKGKVKRAISAGAGLIFKGSGFYITDYRSDKYKEAAKKDTAPATASTESKSTSSGDGKTSSKTESKPAAAKTETKTTKPSPAKS
jgi:putative FmdB family regulatory protein